MSLRRLVLPALLVCAVPAQAQQLSPDQVALKAHVQFLAADALQGREAGTRDYDVAAEYVAAQMLAIGLKPAGEGGGWFQPVRVATYRASDKPSWTVTNGRTSEPLRFGVDFVNQGAPATPDFAATAPVVFAGYGLVYPDGKRDDYAGLDVRGKIVAVLPGTPKGLPNAVEAHFSDDDQKAQLAETRGAKAVVVLQSAATEAAYPFVLWAPVFNQPHSSWVGPDGQVHVLARAAPVVGLISMAGAAKLFAGSAIRWVDVLAAERRGARMPTGPLAAMLSVATKTTRSIAESRNVAGLIGGSDPALKAEVIVVSAHLDHVGVGEPVDGDRIYNGAMDNAAGVATMLEAARGLIAGPRPRRSILFVALTAEEKGLVGSSYLTAHPLPGITPVADLNVDMPILTYPVQDLVVLGGERSTIGGVAAAAAAAEGLKVVPDPAPEQLFFVRSDHYSFVQAGIPAVSIDTGPGGAGAVAQRAYLANHYHQPSDQIDLPFDWASAAKFTRVVGGTARGLADAPARPRWMRGDFFGLRYGGFGAR